MSKQFSTSYFAQTHSCHFEEILKAVELFLKAGILNQTGNINE